MQVTRNPNRGLEVAYAEITAAVGVTATIADVSGLSVTFIAGARPVIVEFGASFAQAATANSYVAAFITDPSNVEVTRALATSATANAYFPLLCRRRLALVSGTSYTYKVRVNTSVGTGTLFASTQYPAWLQVTEI